MSTCVRWFPILLAATCLLGRPSFVAAQPPVWSLAALAGRVDAGATVTVTDSRGETLQGRVARIAADHLEMTIGDETRRFHASDIALIERRRNDSVFDGTTIGAGVSVGAIALTTLIVCPNCAFGDDFVEVLGVFGLIGGGIGLAVDASIRGLHPVYIAGLSAPAAGPSLTVAPLARRGGGGAAVVLRY